MGKITIQDLASVLISRHGLSKKDAAAFIGAMFDIIQKNLETDKLVKIKGLGTFKIIDVDDRESVNVNTGERVLIEGHGKITFTPDSLMKELVNKPFSQFETVVLNEGIDFADTPQVDVEPEQKIGEEIVFEQQVVEEHVSKETLTETASNTIDPALMPLIVQAETVVSQEVPLIEEENTETEDELQPETTPEPQPEDETETKKTAGDSKKRWFIICAACMLFLVGGYLLGNNFSSSSPQVTEQKVVPEKPATPKASVPKPVTANPAIETSVTKEKPKAEAEKTAAVKPAETNLADQPASTISLHDQYASKDARVRLGAYRIVGTDQVIKARAGETIAKISRRYFGPDMECYVEVFNDLKASAELKPGQEIKIPKLEYKKKKSNK